MTFLSVWLLMLAIDGARYLVAVALVFWIFWVWGRERFRSRWLHDRWPSIEKILHDVRWSASTIVVFSLFGVAIWFGKPAGIFQTYVDVAERGWPYFFGSILGLIVLQDTYFYWTHRAMHHPWLYRLVHATHHQSIETTPWTAYAFSPFEAIVHATFVPLVLLFVPLHDAAVFVFLGFMIVRNALGHMSIELLPRGFTRRRLLGLSTTTTHHALHHRHFNANYGLYFTWWDRLMGTTHRDYERAFDRVVSR